MTTAREARRLALAMTARRRPTNPDEATLRAFGLSFPETTEEFPWEHRALKVRGKVFVMMGTGREAGADHDDFFISCKLPQSAAVALLDRRVRPTGYGLGKAGWVSAQYPRGKAPLGMLKDWLRESYQAVAPKKLAVLVDAGRGLVTNEPKKTTAKRSLKKVAAKKTAAKPSPKKKASKKRS